MVCTDIVFTQCPECGSFNIEFFTSGWYCHSCCGRIDSENCKEWLLKNEI